MSQFNNSQIIAPPIEEEIFPYRRVWRSVMIQILVIIVVSAILVIANELFGIFQFDDNINFGLSLMLGLFPMILWIAFSLIPERFVDQPRRNLVTLALISGLTASAIGIPLIRDFFQIDRWIALQSAFERILGYTFTVGIVDTGLRFIVLRYLVFPHRVRIRSDTIAFCVASTIGYVTVLNVTLIFEVRPTLTLATIYILGNFTMHITSSLILAYGLAQTVLDEATSILLPFIILASAFLIGIISPFESGLTNGGLTIDGSFSRPLFSLGFLVIVLVVVPSAVFFLYTVAERREREKYSSDQ